MSCYLCRSPEDLIYGDDLIRVTHLSYEEGQSAYLGSLVIQTQRHTEGLASLYEAESLAIGLWIGRLSRALVETEKPEHIYSFVIGHKVPHVHFHLVPRYPGTPPEYWGLRLWDWPDAPRGGPSERSALCDRLRSTLIGRSR
jgi:diadenosine tetraphosphate (Ap4A) HIT family hydrolase